jgi:hypothetical protein
VSDSTPVLEPRAALKLAGSDLIAVAAGAKLEARGVVDAIESLAD